MSEAGGPVDASSRTRLWPASVAVIAMASLLGVVVAIAVTRGSGTDDPATTSPDSPVTAATVRLEPVTYRSDAPFTESIVTVSDDEIAGLSNSVAVREDADAPLSGDAAGLYAVTGSRPVCELNRLVAGLAANPEAAAAWAAVVGVEPSAAAATVQSFTPVILTRDTAVTNHTYRSGEANGYASILQAGTPVLVDENGTPRTQCSCGNPLLPPSQDAATVDDDTTFEGDRWESFAPKQVVEVAPAPKPLTTIEVIDTETGKARPAPVGAVVELDGVLATTQNSIVVRADDGTVTPVVPEEASAAFDDGRGGVVYTLGESTPDPYERVYDGPPSDPAERSIWHLPAGANEAVQLVANDDPGIWHHIFGVGQLGGRTYVMFSPLRVDEEDTGQPHSVGSLVAMDLDSGGQRVLMDEAIGWEFGLGSLSFGGDRMAVEAGDYSPFWVVFDAQLNEVPVPCGSPDMTEEVAQTCPRWGALDEQGDLNYFASGVGGNFEFIESEEIVVENPLTRAVTARHTMSFGIMSGHTQSGVTEVRRGKAVSWFHLGEGVDESSTMIVDIATGEPVDLPPEMELGQLSVLQAPLRRPVQPVTPPAPPTTPARGDASKVDVMNAMLPEDSCISEGAGSPPIRLEDWSGQSGDDVLATDYVAAGVRPDAFAVSDVDGDGTTEIVIAVVCSWGGNLGRLNLLTLAAAPDGTLRHLVPPVENFGDGIRWIEAVDKEDRSVRLSILVDDNDDGEGDTVSENWHVVGGKWVEVG